MRKVAIALILALGLSGCVTDDLRSAFHIVTTPVTVTPAMVYDAENGLKIAAAGLVGYRRLCLKKVIDPVSRNCRAVIKKIQPYTIAAQAAIIDLRAALKVDDQATAVTVYKALTDLITHIQTERAAAGV